MSPLRMSHEGFPNLAVSSAVIKQKKLLTLTTIFRLQGTLSFSYLTDLLRALSNVFGGAF